MSTFFKALEQAEQDRARRDGAAPRPALSPTAPRGAVDVAPHPGPAVDDPERVRPDRAADEPAPARPASEQDGEQDGERDGRVDGLGPAGPTRVDEAAAPRATKIDGSAPAHPEPRPLIPAIERAAPAGIGETVVAEGPGDIDEHLVSLLQPAGFAAEQYRALRHVVEQHRKSSGRCVFAVSSPGAGDGKTTTAINLAGALAQGAASRVLLIDADLRQPSLGERLGLGSAPAAGLVDLITASGAPLEAVVRRLSSYNLSVLPAGYAPTAPYEVLESPRFEDVLEAARRSYDYVVVDTPPILSAPDCRMIGKRVDGVLIVIAAHRTSRKLLEEALDQMEPSKVMGLIFTRDDGLLHAESARNGSRYFPGP